MDSFFNKVYVLSEMGEVDEALKMLDSIPENHSEYPRALFYKSTILDKYGDKKEAERLLKLSFKKEAIRQSEMGDEDLLLEAALEDYGRGNLFGALENLTSCLKLSPDCFDALKLKSKIHVGFEDIDEALDTINKALKIKKDDSSLLADKAFCMDYLGRFKESEEYFDKAKESDSNNDYIWNLMSRASFNRDDIDLALEYIDTAIRLNPDNIENIIFKAHIFKIIEDYENMKICWDAAEKIDENDFQVLSAKIEFYMHSKDYEKAIVYIDKCLMFQPDSNLLLMMKITAASQLGDDVLEKNLLELSETNPEFLEELMDGELDMESEEYEDGKSPIFYMYNIYKVLSNLKNNPNIDNIFSNTEFRGYLDKDFLKNVIFDEEFVKPINSEQRNIKKEAEKKSPSELSHLLAKYGITASGKKKKLVKLAVKHVPEIEFADEFELTAEGEEFINENELFKFYDYCLKDFDLVDMEEYLEEDNFNWVSDYLDEYIELAHENEDFDLIDKCYIAKSLAYRYLEDYENSLKEALKEFILNLNPFYSYSIHHAMYVIFNDRMIDNIQESLKHLDNINLKKLFDELWDLKDGKTDFCSKKEGFSYLERALDGEDLEDLTEEYLEKYIDV